MKSHQWGWFFSALVPLIGSGLAAQQAGIELRNPAVLLSKKIKPMRRETLIEILQVESSSRAGLQWRRGENRDLEDETILAIVFSNEKKLAGRYIPGTQGNNLPENLPEGYRLLINQNEGKTIIWIIATDFRGMIYGVGHLLRLVQFEGRKCYLPAKLNIVTAPEQSIRGFQLGYRDLANSYDAWDAGQYEKYIRELALFGANAIENIPFDESNDSVHMPIPREEMHRRMSAICEKYDLDYWVWTPAAFDLRDRQKRQAMLATHSIFYKNCPRLDNVFFPGGDPGENHPRQVMPFLRDLSFRLKRYHPDAGIWISLQGFSAEEIDYFYHYLDEKKPDWLRGVVSGPGSPPIAETRFRLPQQYQHRHYPDITHNLCCEYPVKNWDQAFALTIGREGINPMPGFYAKIQQKYAPFTDGFIAYSDGAHDDVNKIIWSQRGWDGNKNIGEILVEYCRFFFAATVAEDAANGILALENNWRGPAIANGGIETTFVFWQNLQKNNPRLVKNWRWQMLLLRAYYDTYQRRRKIYEQGLEKKANAILALAPEIGSEKAMQRALVMLNKADTEPVAQDLHAKIVQLCDDLFHSIGLQTDMLKYHAAGAQRGCILQFVNYPLNNRWWLADEFEKIKVMKSKSEKLRRLKIIRTWENPGQGSYYDNISNIETGPRVLTTQYDACDVAWWNGGYSRARLSSQLFQSSPVLQYEDLDFNGRYFIRVAGQGEALLRADGERLEPVLYNKGLGEFKEFIVPRHITRDGRLRVTFDIPEESHLNWRRYSHISDIWLIKR